VTYEPWCPGHDGEGFLVGTPDNFELAVYRNDEIANPIHFILAVAQEHAAGDVGALFGAIGADAMGRFMLRVKETEKANLWRIARSVVVCDPRLSWAGPGEITTMRLGRT
jgi:hypothetical protein